MPRSEEANRQIRDVRRETLLQAAVEIFGRNGYVGTRIDDIAALAGISKGLVYHYFRSKEALFTALVEGAANGTARLFQGVRELPGDVAHRLRWLIDQEVSGMMGAPYRFLVILQALITEAAPYEARNAIVGMLAQEEAAIVPLLAEGQRDDQIVRGDPYQLFLLLRSCVQGMAASMATQGLHSGFPSAESLWKLFVTPEMAARGTTR
ncbi:MAG: TetR/AcrR family transcriptional regulator [Thermaerobacter sp.]|nr:TetR/AcrR family transcriptional regulator [Thermaerobacter sp.]